MVCFLSATSGLAYIMQAQGPGGVRGIGTLATSVIVGVVAATGIRYFGARRSELKDQQQIAVETLAKLAEHKGHSGKE